MALPIISADQRLSEKRCAKVALVGVPGAGKTSQIRTLNAVSTLLVDTAGSHVGQLNGLAVIQLGDSSFAHPVRITATARVGDGEVIDIEREVKLGGPIHSKGVLILSSFVASHFGAGAPLSLRASLVFEQSYGGVEGDSASLAELAALLSAIALRLLHTGYKLRH